MNIGDLIKSGVDGFLREIINSIILPAVEKIQEGMMGVDGIREFIFFETLAEACRAMGIMLITLFAMWQIFKSFFAFTGIAVEDPMTIVYKLISGIFLVWYGGDILMMSLELVNALVAGVAAATFSGDGTVASLLETIIFSFSGGSLAFSIFSWTIIPMGYILYQLIRLMVRMFQRRVLMTFLILAAPLAMACGVSKSTEGFQTGFIRVYAGNLIILLMQNVLLSAMSIYAMNDLTNAVNFVIIIGIFYVFDRLEPLIREMSIATGLERDVGGAFSALQSVSGVVSNVRNVTGAFR